MGCKPIGDISLTDANNLWRLVCVPNDADAHSWRRCALLVPSALAAIALERPNDYFPVWEVHGAE
jgi:hypothetical protein